VIGEDEAMSTTHLLKPRTPLSDPRMRCGIRLSAAPKGDVLGSEDGIADINCAGCLRDLVVEMRLEKSGAIGPFRRDPSDEDIWLAGGDTGISSKTIWSVMTGKPVDCRPSVPMDPSDFGRCHRLLEKFPAWRARMPEVAVKHPQWSGLVSEWETLTALYLKELPSGKAPKLYKRIIALTGSGS
jgi:hypothetical protein